MKMTSQYLKFRLKQLLEYFSLHANTKRITVFFLTAILFTVLSFPNVWSDGGVIKVGVYDNAPIAFRNAQGKYEGLSIEVLEYIAKMEGWDLEYIHGTWSECLERLENAEIDLQVYIAYSRERAKKYDFTSETLITNWGVIYSRPGSVIETLPDLEGKRVALLKGAIHAVAFNELIRSFNINTSIVEVENNLQSLRFVHEGKVDAGVVNRIFGLFREKEFDIERTPIIFNPIEVRYAMPKGGNKELGNAIDRHLKILKEDKKSIYYLSFNKAFGLEVSTEIPDWIIWMLAIGAGVVVVVIVMTMILRHQVKIKTAELHDELMARKQAEEVLLESEERFRSIVKNTDAGYFFIDKDGFIQDVNDTWLNMYKYSSPKEVIGVHYRIIQKIEDVEKAKEFVDGIMREDSQYLTGEFSRKCKDGTIGYHTFSARPAVRSGETVGIEGFIIDTTDRKKAEEALGKSEERLIEAQQVAKFGHYIVDIKTGYWTNSAGLDDIFGTDNNYKKDVDGWLQIIHPDSREIMSNYFQNNILGQRQKFDKEYKIINIKTGQEKWVHGLGALKYDEYNNPFELFGTIQDITERKKAEEEREKLISDLQTASAKIKTLSEIIPICAWCKKIRDDEEYWKQVEEYIRDHTEAEFSHGLCPECAAKMEKEIGERE